MVIDTLPGLSPVNQKAKHYNSKKNLNHKRDHGKNDIPQKPQDTGQDDPDRKNTVSD